MSKPNIVFILADDLAYMDVGCNKPKTFYETPNIYALAKRGMRFTQGYAACCVCSPTRGSIITGKYPPRTGVTGLFPGKASGMLQTPVTASHLALEEITIAEALRDGGYATFFAGKWHLGGGAFYPGAQGFPKELVSEGRRASAQFWYPKSDLPAPDHKDDPKTTERIADEKVIVSSAEVKSPVAVRYAWENWPTYNLYNGAGLPASPFRTDDWK